MQLVRKSGGLQETLALPSGRNVATIRDAPFEVTEEEGKALLADKTERWRLATKDDKVPAFLTAPAKTTSKAAPPSKPAAKADDEEDE